MDQETKRQNQLILQHLLSSNILQPDGTEEILSIFPKDIASTVAISIASSFNEGSSHPEISSQFTLDWILQPIAYCLSLSTLFQKSLYSSMSIFHHWLTDPNFFKDDKMWNIYARRLLRYLSQVVEHKNDRSDQFYRLCLIEKLFQDFSFYQKSLHDRFDDETWNTFIRIMIGISDYLIQECANSNELKATNSRRKALLVQTFLLTFEILINSGLKTKEIWSVFFEFCSKWSTNEFFLDAWRKETLHLFENLLELLYSNKPPSGNVLNMLGFHLHQFTFCIDTDILMNHSRLFNNLTDLVEALSEKLRLKAEQVDGLYKPKPPSSIFFELFGHWCFNLHKIATVQYQTIIMKVLMSISGHWELTPEWSKVIYSTILTTVTEVNTQTMLVSIMRSGRHFFRQFINNEVIDIFYQKALICNPENICKAFYISYATLLSEIAERKIIDPSVITKLARQSPDLNPKLQVLKILLVQNSLEFLNQLKVIMKPDANALSIDLIRMLCLLVASAMPFISIEKADELITFLFECVSENYHKSGQLIPAFFVLVHSFSRWNDSIYRPDFSKRLISFLVDLKQVNGADISDISKVICGRPVDRSIQKVATSKEMGTFMIKNQSLVTVYGEKERKDKLTLHVREPRGFFIWELEDVIEKDLLCLQKDDQPPLSQIQQIDQIRLQITKEKSDEKIKKEIAKSVTADPDYSKPSNHYKKSYLSIYDEKDRLRHKIIDFLIQTQLVNNIVKINGDVHSLLSEFDSIESVPYLNIPVYHTNINGFTDEVTPLFNRFISLLGSYHSEKVGYQSKLGLIDLFYSKKLEQDQGDIGVIFNECSLRFNHHHESIPKHKLLFYVTPFNQSFYFIRCKCSNLSFFCDISKKRMIGSNNIASAISMAIFQFIALVNPDFFFQKNHQRSTFLENIKTESITPIDIVNGYALDALA